MGRGSHPPARLAELVAALSLGVDLGFGQPMEHVLRQCLIALRLADHAGLGEQDRIFRHGYRPWRLAAQAWPRCQLQRYGRG